jgi:hypothetical protein
MFRPVGVLAIGAWLLWVAGVSFAVLAVADIVVRRLLPLSRLLQLCLVFPDRAPSRVRLAVSAARARRPEHLAESAAGPADAQAAAVEIVRLLAALTIHDRRTRGHSERVCAFTDLLAAQMQLPQWDRDRLMWVALVHDIGKLKVTPRLLNKPGKPTIAEWRTLQAHPLHGDALVAPLRGWLGPWADTVLQHHERYDGLGYPHRLRGDAICLGARIIAVTDAFEVMTAPRPYRRPVDAQSARAELARHAGTQFDPDVVRHFLAVGLPQLRTSMGWVSWLTQVPLLRDWPKLQAASGAAASQAVTATAVASSAGALMLGASGSLAHADAATLPVSPSSTMTTGVSGATAASAAPDDPHRPAAVATPGVAAPAPGLAATTGSTTSAAEAAPETTSVAAVTPTAVTCTGAGQGHSRADAHSRGRGHAYGRHRHHGPAC